jgi:hypothetical protein
MVGRARRLRPTNHCKPAAAPMDRHIRGATVSTLWALARESEEWIGPLTVAVNGAPITTYQVAVVRHGQRPTTWATPDNDPQSPGTALGVLVGPATANVLTPGTWRIWVKVTLSPEVPVLDDAGTIIIS